MVQLPAFATPEIAWMVEQAGDHVAPVDAARVTVAFDVVTRLPAESSTRMSKAGLHTPPEMQVVGVVSYASWVGTPGPVTSN